MDYLSEVSFMYVNENFFDIKLRTGKIRKATMEMPKKFNLISEEENLSFFLNKGEYI